MSSTINTHSIDLEAGSSQYLSITDAAQTGLDLAGNCTFEMWIKLETDVAMNLVTKWNTTGDQRSYILELGNTPVSNVTFSASSAGTAGTSGSASVNWNPDTGTYYHLAVVYTAASGQIELFINGVSQGTATGTLPTSIFNGTAAFNIGALNGGAAFADGLIDEVRVWSTTKTGANILASYRKELVGNETNLVAYWQLDNDLLDLTANNNDLTNNGVAVHSTDVGFTGGVEETETWSITDAFTGAASSTFSVSDSFAITDTGTDVSYGWANLDKSSAPSVVNLDKS